MKSSYGRRLCSDLEASKRGFSDQASGQRRRVLQDTVNALAKSGALLRYRQIAAGNLERWKLERKKLDSSSKVAILSGDWGVVTHDLSVKYGECFAVLNMANAHTPGGAYVEGAIAQEENMFRRTDCHFQLAESEFDAELDSYLPSMTRLLSGQDGYVYLDTRSPRVCIRGPEDRSRNDLGYEWLPEHDIFPFFELRASAQDLRGGFVFNRDLARAQIAAQFDTLRLQRIRHAVLGAFGCGAFRNPSEQVADLYKKEIAARSSDFDLVAFAIFSPGYGPDNYSIFRSVFESE